VGDGERSAPCGRGPPGRKVRQLLPEPGNAGTGGLPADGGEAVRRWEAATGGGGDDEALEGAPGGIHSAECSKNHYTPDAIVERWQRRDAQPDVVALERHRRVAVWDGRLQPSHDSIPEGLHAGAVPKVVGAVG
jgi:hypothetical protein